MIIAGGFLIYSSLVLALRNEIAEVARVPELFGRPVPGPSIPRQPICSYLRRSPAKARPKPSPTHPPQAGVVRGTTPGLLSRSRCSQARHLQLMIYNGNFIHQVQPAGALQ